MDTSYVPAGQRRLRRAGAALAGPWAILVALAALLGFVPLAPSMPSAGLDPSWAYALNVAVARGLVFGRDIIFTFGPYAAVYTRTYTPGTDRMMLAGSVIVALGFAAGLVALARPDRRLAALATSVCVGITYPRDAIGFTLPLLALLLVADAAERRRAAGAVLSALMLSLAVLVLVKESYAAATGAALLCGVPVLAWRGRVRLAGGCVVVFGGSLAALWVLAGQPLAALPRYFIGVLPIMEGYGQAMALQAPYPLVALCAVAVIVMVALPQRELRGRLGGGGLLLGLGVLLVLALAFKAGFARGDFGHVAIVAGTLLLAGGAISLVVPARSAITAWAVGLAIWLGVMPLVLPASPGIVVWRLGQSWSFAVAGLIERVSHPADLDLIYQASLAAIRREMPLPAVSGPADIYSFNQASLIAAGLDWAPRPVLQSYSAYTPGLQELDRDHLLGADAPATVFFRVEPIDGRFPALEDGPSWPVLLTRYRADALLPGSGLAVLRRVPDAAPSVGAPPLLAGRFGLGETIPLPASDAPLWVTIDLYPSLAGRLLDAAYRIPMLAITLTCDDGTTPVYRYVPEMGRAGFLISPLIRTTEEFVALQAPDRRLARPTSFRIDGHRFGWQGTFDVTLRALDLPRDTAEPGRSR